MKKQLITGMLSLSFLGAIAQELPKPSPLSKVEQAVGLTNLTIEYSRPSVKGRVIFGDLVPYNQVWRLGANAPTKLTTTKELSFGGEVLQPGTYAVFAIPEKDGEWKVVINTDIEQWGAGNYDEAKNVVTVGVKPQRTPFQETFSITIEDLTANSASIVIAWENTKVVVPFTMDTDKLAMENIEVAINEGKDLEKVYSNAAAYFRDAKKDLKTAMVYVDKSIAVKPYYANLFLKARILEESGNKKEAIATAKRALKDASEAKATGYESFIKETITRWEKK